ncbi:MAG: hypothetical protein BRC25_03515 [Parcubacteria group bacterium SW_6_46_9]|nr:MAG: hypothetical protein BRC25_03515 [Parcubacteria group bacterium SW_6_46_9]
MQNNQQQNSQQTRAQKEGTSWLKIIGIFFGVIVGIIILIGILSGVVLNSLSGDREAARDARRATDLNQIQTSVSMYEDENGQYPDSLSAVEESGSMTSIPTDPETNQPYEYAKTNKDTNFCLGTCMEAKEESDLPNNHSQQCVQQLDLTCENGTPFALDGTSRY